MSRAAFMQIIILIEVVAVANNRRAKRALSRVFNDQLRDIYIQVWWCPYVRTFLIRMRA